MILNIFCVEPGSSGFLTVRSDLRNKHNILFSEMDLRLAKGFCYQTTAAHDTISSCPRKGVVNFLNFPSV